MPTVCRHFPCPQGFGGDEALLKVDMEGQKDVDREAVENGCGCDPPSVVCTALSVCDTIAGGRCDERVEPYDLTMGRHPFLKGMSA
jgi:hypothetical protein